MQRWEGFILIQVMPHLVDNTFSTNPMDPTIYQNAKKLSKRHQTLRELMRNI